jgi:hypothetical protein
MSRKTIIWTTIWVVVAAVVVIGFLVQWQRVKGNPDENLTHRIGIWVGAICIFGILSYLYSENPVYRFFEHMLLGLGLGFSIALTGKDVLWDKWWLPVKAAVSAFATGMPTSKAIWDINLIFAAIFGMLLYFQYSRKYLWLSRITIGITAGMGAGLAVKSTAVTTLPQITSTFKVFYFSSRMAPNLSAAEQVREMVQNLLFLTIVCCVLYYFFFSFRRESGLAKSPATLGRFFLMISFGAFFGNTFMTRVVLLIERIQYLLHDWLMV